VRSERNEPPTDGAAEEQLSRDLDKVILDYFDGEDGRQGQAYSAVRREAEQVPVSRFSGDDALNELQAANPDDALCQQRVERQVDELEQEGRVKRGPDGKLRPGDQYK
jgi:hypothetical protein